MARADPTFSSQDIIRIFRSNLTSQEQIDVRKSICTDEDIDAVKSAAEIFKLLKFGPGAFKAIGTAGELLFTVGSKVLESRRGLERATIANAIVGFLSTTFLGIDRERLNPDLRLQRLPLRGGG